MRKSVKLLAKLIEAHTESEIDTDAECEHVGIISEGDMQERSGKSRITREVVRWPNR